MKITVFNVECDYDLIYLLSIKLVIKLYIRSQLCELAMDTDTSETRNALNNA